MVHVSNPGGGSAMATQTLVTCDIHNDGLTAGHTVSFGVEGKQYEIDLCDAHRNELVGTLERYIELGRDVARPSRGMPLGSGRSRSRSDLAQIREWAANNGYSISTRGRIAQDVITAYEAAGFGR